MDKLAAKDGNEPQRLRNDNGRRSWSEREEKVLAVAVKEIINEGWRSENGFKSGYLNLLATKMKEVFPNTTIKAEPHITSRLTVWKKNYNSLFQIIKQTGVGVDSTTNMVDATDEQWEAAIKRDSNARHIRNKSWPLYEAWCEIFGATRATGEAAEDFVNAAAPASSSQPALNPDSEANNDSILIMEETQGESKAPFGYTQTGESSAMGKPTQGESKAHFGYTQTGESSAMGKSMSGRKRKTAVIADPLIPIMSSFCDTAAARLGEIVQRIGYEQDMSTARKEVYKLVSKMNLLTVKEKLRVTRLICRNSEDLDIFFSLPDTERTEWAMMLLNDDI